MPRASFSFGSPAQAMEVNYTWWGREEYLLNGQLFHRAWNLSLAAKRQFQVGPHAIRIEVSVGPKEYFTRVFVDDVLHVDELFPKVKAQVETWKKPVRFMLLAVVGLIIGALLAFWGSRS